MPFAGYKDFADCVRRNQAKENPEAYCAAIERQAKKGILKTLLGWFIATEPRREAMRFQRTVSITKLDEEKQIAYGPVLEPDLPDAQGDVMSVEDIEKAAHRFMLKAQLGRASADGINHEIWVGHSKAHVVESWIAHEDMTHGGDTIRKGTWMLGVHLADPALWDSVKKGELTGFSIGGRGIRL